MHQQDSNADAAGQASGIWEAIDPYQAQPGFWRGRAQRGDGHATQSELCAHPWLSKSQPGHADEAAARACGEDLAARLRAEDTAPGSDPGEDAETVTITLSLGITVPAGTAPETVRAAVDAALDEEARIVDWRPWTVGTVILGHDADPASLASKAAGHAAQASELLTGSPCRCGDAEDCPCELAQRSIAMLAQAHATTGQLYAALAQAATARTAARPG